MKKSRSARENHPCSFSRAALRSRDYKGLCRESGGPRLIIPPSPRSVVALLYFIPLPLGFSVFLYPSVCGRANRYVASASRPRVGICQTGCILQSGFERHCPFVPQQGQNDARTENIAFQLRCINWAWNAKFCDTSDSLCVSIISL